MRRVLIIADSWERLDHYEHLLSSRFSVVTAPFGQEGLRLAVVQPPHWIVIDVGFEDMSAREIEAELDRKENLMKIPRLVVSEEKYPAREGSVTRWVSSAEAWSHLADLIQ